MWRHLALSDQWPVSKLTTPLLPRIAVWILLFMSYTCSFNLLFILNLLTFCPCVMSSAPVSSQDLLNKLRFPNLFKSLPGPPKPSKIPSLSALAHHLRPNQTLFIAECEFAVKAGAAASWKYWETLSKAKAKVGFVIHHLETVLWSGRLTLLLCGY